jgi:hypothetical protein
MAAAQALHTRTGTAVQALRMHDFAAVQALRLDTRLAARRYSHTAVVYSIPAVATAAGCMQPSYWCNCRAAAAAVASTVQVTNHLTR